MENAMPLYGIKFYIRPLTPMDTSQIKSATFTVSSVINGFYVAQQYFASN